jgi:hypothetical protein
MANRNAFSCLNLKADVDDPCAETRAWGGIMSTVEQAAAAASRGGWKRRASGSAFLVIIAIAMFGWLVGLAWLAISVAEWLFA